MPDPVAFGCPGFASRTFYVRNSRAISKGLSGSGFSEGVVARREDRFRGKMAMDERFTFGLRVGAGLSMLTWPPFSVRSESVPDWSGVVFGCR